MLRSLLAAATALALVASATAATAQDDPRERSRAAFRRGVAQAETGDYASARDSFLEAYRIFPHPSILLNVGIARAHTGQWVEAEQDLVHFLADDGGAQPAELGSARAELAEARSHLGTFRLRVAPVGASAMVDRHAVALLVGEFVEVRATRGPHSLHVEAAGYRPVNRAVTVDGDHSPSVDIALTSAAEPAPASTPADGARIAAWFLLGAGVVAAGVGTYAGLEATSLANEYNTPGNAHFQDGSTKASGIVFRTSADASFVAALAFAGSGLYLLLTHPAAPDKVEARFVVGPVTGVAGRF